MERISKSKVFRGLVLALVLAVSGFAVSACGSSEEEKTGLAEGEPVKLGSLEYNVLFTRPLNINDIEDSEYLVGKPAPGPDQMYIGVFVHVHNSSDDPQQIPDTFKIKTTTGIEYENIPSKSVYALDPGATVQPHDNIPQTDATAQVGPIGASMLLYLINRQSAEERPVQLYIEGEDGPATFNLDL